MGVLDELVAAVEAGGGDAGRKELVVAFLRGAGPVVVELGAEGLRAVMGVAARGGDVSQAVIERLDARGVAGLLATTEGEMAGLAALHGAEVRAARAAMERLQAVALGVVARALMGI